MSSSEHYAVIDGRYPWGVSPMAFGAVSMIFKLLAFICWLAVCAVSGRDHIIGVLFLAFFPEIVLAGYEVILNRKLGSIRKALLNVMRSAGMIKESRPAYRTIFGYNRIESAPAFYIDLLHNGYLLTFMPQGCPNADCDLLLLLQQELPGYEVIPAGRVNKQYIIKRRRRRGKLMRDEDFN